ncbi:hypothetical protein A0V01_05455 (plasmid) [Borrelia hermsii]|uniref:Uncharacterized protein n=1 Tax=Borrelia hermsii TaxID=140 RepID=A0AAN0X6U7_BORHE|nr:hypothetical protein A0V01_05455 [Borrelia hermsii]
MSSLAKKKKFKSQDTKDQIKSTLKNLLSLNKNKTSPDIKKIFVLQVESQIRKMFKRYNRILKVYWTIDTKNINYKQSDEAARYSASNILQHCK